MHKNFIKILAFSLLAVGLCAVPATSYSATPQEAEAVARQYGIPEDTIQVFWNEYYTNPELYPPERIDELIAQFKEYQKSIVTTVPYNPDATVPAVSTTTAVPVTGSGSTAPTDSPTTPADDSITLTMPDGSTFTRISSAQFIALSYDEKMTYLSTFTEEQQTVIINNLSPEEYRSMLKQLPMEDKLNVVGNLSSISDSLGVNLTVDELTDDSVSFSMKNQDGELVGVGSINDTIEETGYDRRGILGFAGALIMSGFAGLFLLVKKCLGENCNE
ncbi:MAG: hypothetical protein NC340_07390 [Ruminococcus flavefaciens]|nr:hypothetical protein [Ruminococcus flavefaciens]MCM1231617.1 hypothetical protein [Ruminococcus flavefaciens]